MSRIYTGAIDIDIGTDSNQMIFIFQTGIVKGELHSFELFSDVTEPAILKLELVRWSAPWSGSAGITARPVDPDIGSSGLNVASATGETGSASSTLCVYYWDQIGSLLHKPLIDNRIIIDSPQGNTNFGLHLSTNGNNANIGGYIIWEEF